MESNFSLLTLVPPICILVCAYITRKVISSILLGILLATLIAKNFNIVEAIKLSFHCLLDITELDKFLSLEHFWETWNLFICIFLLMLGIIVALLQHSGSAYAYARHVKKYIHDKRTAENSSIFLSFCLLIDDYFNSLTVGSIMHPLTDAIKIPRAKLAFLVHSLSSPLVILCPFSSWVAAILGYLRKSGIGEIASNTTFIIANPLMVYFYVIPFIFYSIILIIVVVYMTQTRLSFGLMKKHEIIADQTGNVFGGEEIPEYLVDLPSDNPYSKTKLIDFFVPIFVLIVCIIMSMLYSGEWKFLGGKNSLLEALQNSSAASALFLGGAFSLVICLLFFVMRKLIKIKLLPKICMEGISLMFSSVVTLMLAWTFGYILNTELHTGEHLAKILINSVNITMLPILLFVIAFIITFVIGTAWGTAAMLFPLIIPMVPTLIGIKHIPDLSEVQILIPIIGAILSGCIAGNHNSPISDTTIMSSSSTRTTIIDHIRTQIPYSIPIMISTAIGFVLSSVLINYGLVIACIVPLAVSILLSIGIMHICHAFSPRGDTRLLARFESFLRRMLNIFK